LTFSYSFAVLKVKTLFLTCQKKTALYRITKATFYQWKKKYSGMDAELLRKFKELERENSELKRMYADLSLDHRILKNVIEKKL
jgi:hypothetical protein